MNPAVTERAHEVNDLVGRITDLEGQLEVAKMAIGVLKADLQIIAHRFLAEAQHRQWCPEYNDWVTSVNDECTDAHLLHCPEVPATVDHAEFNLVVEAISGTDVAAVLCEALDGITAIRTYDLAAYGPPETLRRRGG